MACIYCDKAVKLNSLKNLGDGATDTLVPPPPFPMEDSVFALVMWRPTLVLWSVEELQCGQELPGGHSSYNRVWPWNWYSHWLLLCEEQERYVSCVLIQLLVC